MSAERTGRPMQALDSIRSPQEVSQLRGRTVLQVEPGNDHRSHPRWGLPV